MAKKQFYSNAYLYLSLGVFIVLIGFAPSYFTKLSQVDSAHHFHGIFATLWMVLLVVQPLLYKKHQLKLHRILGWISLAVAGMVVLGSIYMMKLTMMKIGNFKNPLIVYKFQWIDIIAVLSFILFIILAMVHRKNTQLHARYMVATIFAPLNPALSRVLTKYGIMSDFNLSLHVTHILLELTIIVLILDDKRSGKIRMPYLLCLGLMLFQHLLFEPIARMEWWQQLMNRFADLPM